MSNQIVAADISCTGRTWIPSGMNMTIPSVFRNLHLFQGRQFGFPRSLALVIESRIHTNGTVPAWAPVGRIELTAKFPKTGTREVVRNIMCFARDALPLRETNFKGCLKDRQLIFVGASAFRMRSFSDARPHGNGPKGTRLSWSIYRYELINLWASTQIQFISQGLSLRT